MAVGQGGLVSEDALHTREEEVRLGIKHSPIDLKTGERKETYEKKNLGAVERRARWQKLSWLTAIQLVQAFLRMIIIQCRSWQAFSKRKNAYFLICDGKIFAN